MKRDGHFRGHTLPPHDKKQMIESAITAAIAVVTGGFVLTSKIQGKIDALDKRVDCVELTLAAKYVSKQDLQFIVDKMENHLNRIEEKMDRFIERS